MKIILTSTAFLMFLFLTAAVWIYLIFAIKKMINCPNEKNADHTFGKILCIAYAPFCIFTLMCIIL